MTYSLDFTSKAKKQFNQLDAFAKEQIYNYLEKHFGDNPSNPRSHGKPLSGGLKGYWRYEVGKYRLICDIKDNICVVTVIKVAHRREVYR